MYVKTIQYYTKNTINNPLISNQLDYVQYISLIGPNGTGKDILMKHIQKVFTKEYIDDFFNDELEHLHFASKEIGLVLQYPEEQLLEMNVLFNVMNSLFTFNYTLSNTRRKAIEALQFVGLDQSYLNKDPLTLSLYEQRKIILASFLSIDTQLIIFDEPTSGLNKNEKKDLINLLYELNTTKNMTIILLNSNCEDIVNFTDQVFGLRNGELEILGRPDLFYQQPEPLSSQEKEVLSEIMYHAEIDL